MENQERKNQDNQDKKKDMEEKTDSMLSAEEKAARGEEKIDQQNEENPVNDAAADEEASEPSPEEIINNLRKENNELKEKYLRLFAEFDNFKKRTVKERIELMKTAARDTMTALLPVLDDFDRAKKNAVENDTVKLFNEGIGLVHQKLINVLSQKGLQAMETDGEVFDPELHEAFAEIPAASEDMKGKIVDTIEKGYLLKDRIIRHAKVVVGK